MSVGRYFLLWWQFVMVGFVSWRAAGGSARSGTGLWRCRVSAALQVLLPSFLHGPGGSEILRHEDQDIKQSVSAKGSWLYSFY